MPARAAWLKRAALVVILLALTGCVTLAYIDHDGRQSIIRLAATDIRAAASLLAQAHPAAPGTCTNSRQWSDLDLLADALAAVEQLGTSRFEHALETLLVRIASFIGWPAPDFSMGPSQIRPSTAEAALRSAGAAGAPAYPFPGRQQIARDLLCDCASHELGVLVLRMLLRKHPGSEAELSRETIMRLAGEYNAQVTSPTAEAAIANYLYRELTYQVFQELKFRLRRAA
ncbi:MAG: hypothetical protein APF80_14020 [Alphaproteobacteria bacterium BRH_c36]|nr:MAG: hypothetical protein APF80_14020 [Alphaproteobacteria bacterium BRH_c36]